MGINEKVKEGFWNEISEKMINYFKQGQYAIGLAEGVKMAGHALSDYFPYQKDDKNELSDDVSFG